MGEYAEDDLMSAMDDEFQIWDEDCDEPIPTAHEVALYQLATVFYDFHVHPKAQQEIEDILKFYGDNLLRELL